MAAAPVQQLPRGREGGPSRGVPPGHLPEVGDDPHGPAERKARLPLSTSPPGHPAPPGTAGSPPSPPGPSLPDVSDTGDGALVDDLGAHELGGAVLAVLRLIGRQLLRVAEVADPDLLAARIRHQEVFWLQDKVGRRGAWQGAGAPPGEGMSPLSRTESPAVWQEPTRAGAGWEGVGDSRTHFDVQMQDVVLVQVADPLQDLPHVGPDLRESRGKVGAPICGVEEGAGCSSLCSLVQRVLHVPGLGQTPVSPGSLHPPSL